MYHPLFSKWYQPGKIEGLAYFASALTDVLFDFTIDPFKASALNTHTRCLELDLLAKQIANRRALPSSLEPFINELKSSISHDPILNRDTKSHCQLVLQKIENVILRSKSGVEYPDARALTNSLRNSIGTNYLDNIFKKIRDSISNPKDKRNLLKIADILVCELEARGFSRRYVYWHTRNFFFESETPKSISSLTQIDEYLKPFLFPQIKIWTLIYRVGHAFTKHREHANAFGISIHTAFNTNWLPTPLWPPQEETYDRFISRDDRFPLFLEFTNKAAFDPYSARDIAERQIQLFTDVCILHDHISRLTWSGYVLVLSADGHYARVHRPQPEVMHLGLLKPPKDDVQVRDRISDTIHLLSSRRLKPSDESRVFTALEYHRSAIKSNRVENKLLDLWALVEGFATAPDQGNTRLPHYRDLLSSAATLAYSNRVFRALMPALCTHSKYVRLHLESISYGTSLLEKTCAVICFDDLQVQRMSLYGLLDDHPLLKYRIYRAHESFQNPKIHARTLENYHEKVMWQINRIYMMRNQIVHNSRSFPHLGSLVENLHTYVDCLFDCVFSCVDGHDTNLTLSAAMETIKLRNISLLQQLSQHSDSHSTHKAFTKQLFPAQPLTRLFESI